MTDEIKKIILNEHNKLRNKFALGKQPGFKPAKAMATMRWNDELAYLATLNAIKCDFNHDECRATDEYKYAGQNLAIRKKYPSKPETIQGIKDAINDWYKEFGNATQADLDKVPLTLDGPVVGHFTQIVSDKADSIGCGATRYISPSNGINFNALQLSCDYSRTNLGGQPVYISGSTPASGCKTGTNPQYPGLCSENEKVDANAFD
jgi:hypothetical protein